MNVISLSRIVLLLRSHANWFILHDIKIRYTRRRIRRAASCDFHTVLNFYQVKKYRCILLLVQKSLPKSWSLSTSNGNGNCQMKFFTYSNQSSLCTPLYHQSLASSSFTMFARKQMAKYSTSDAKTWTT